MEINFRTTEWLTFVKLDDAGEPLFTMQTYRVATADIGLTGGQMYAHWLPIYIEPFPALLEAIDRELSKAMHEAAYTAAANAAAPGLPSIPK